MMDVVVEPSLEVFQEVCQRLVAANVFHLELGFPLHLTNA
jgi:hypothetical protein